MSWHRAFAALLLAVVAPMVSAHKASDAYVRLEASGDTVTQRFDIALRDLDRDLVLDADNDGQLQWREVLARWPDIDRLAVAGLALAVPGGACVPGPAAAPALDEHSDGRYAVIARTWQCRGGAAGLTADYRLFAGSDPTHRGIVVVRHGAADASVLLTPGAGVKPLIDADGAAPSGFFSVFLEGIHHILIGTDHVLFLLTLLLPAVLVRAGGGWAGAAAWRPVWTDVLKVVTAFTVAHSITLGLAVFGVIDPPSRWVESLIAASVVLAAVNNLWPVVDHGRWRLTFVFGLVHGFGFAGALKATGLVDAALGMPLLAFNLGVEVGQLAIVVVFLPVAWALRNTSFYRRGVLPAASLAIAVLAAVWLVERAFAVSLISS